MCIGYRPQRERAQEAEERRTELPQPHKDPARRYDELDELVRLVQVVLALDVVLFVAAILLELEYGSEVYARAVEWYQPDAENLGDVYVEDEVALVVRYVTCQCNSIASCSLKIRDLPTELTVNSISGLKILYHWYMALIREREFSKLPVRQNGWMNAASGVKYVSIVSRCIEGGDCVKEWITPVISFATNCECFATLSTVYIRIPGFSIASASISHVFAAFLR